MSTDTFEDTLRDLLHSTADTADAVGPGYLDPDADRVIGLGRRVVRRRRYAAGLVAASVVGIAGVVGVTALGPGADQASPPAGTSSAAPSSQVVATADLTRGHIAGESRDDQPGARVAVDLAQRVLITSLLDADGAPFDSVSSSLPQNPRLSTWTSADDASGPALGVVPAAAQEVILVRAGGLLTGPQDLQPLPGTPYRAFASWPAPMDVQAPLAGVVWTDGTTVYDAQGASVRSVDMGTTVAFVDRTQGVFGIFSGGASAGPIPEVPKGSVPSIMLGQQWADGRTTDSTVLLVLPAGAHDVELQTAEFARVNTSKVDGGAGTDEALVIAQLTMPANTPGSGVDAVTWTNADGTPGSGVVGG